MYRIVIDQSTSASKALLFNDLNIVDRIDKKHQQIYPLENYVEHNPHEIISNTKYVIDEIVRKNGLKYHEVKSISITNQRETAVAWKKSSGRPIYNAIVWQCIRTDQYCQNLKQYNQSTNNKTGLRIDSYFSAPKFNWIMDNVSEARDLSEQNDLCLGTIESWLVYNLSIENNHYTDITNASRTLLMDINTNQWSTEQLELFNIPHTALPEIKLPSDNFGTYNGIPLTGVIADSQAALFAQDLEPFTEAKITMGTGSSIMVNIENNNTLRDPNILTAVYQNRGGDNLYALEAIIKSFGDSIEFVKNNLGTFSDYDEIFKYAFSKANNIIYIPGQYGLGSPYWEDDVGCQILNISRNTSREDIAAAAIRSLGFQVNAAIEAIEKILGTNLLKLKVDGGISRQSCFIQFISDLTQKTVEVLAIEEASALGALKITLNESPEIKSGLKYVPNAENKSYEEEYQNWKKAVDLFIKKS